MRKLIRLYHGRKLFGIKCPYCGVKRDGVVYREDFYWRKRLSCGHTIGGSYVLPPSELVRLGFVNRADGPRDPRAISARNVAVEDMNRIVKQRKKSRWVKENLPMGKQYL